MPPSPTPAAAAPAPSPPAAMPAPVQASEPQSVVVADTGGEGVFPRRTPALDDRMKAYPEGTTLAVIGGETEGGGITWLRVRAPDGVEAWVPEQ